MNKVDLSFMATGNWEEVLSSGIVLTPLFAPTSPITTSIVYSTADRKSQERITSNYKLKLSGLDSWYVDKFGLDLSGVAIDYALLNNSDGFMTAKLDNSVKAIDNNGETRYKVIYSGNNNNDHYFDKTVENNAMTLEINLSILGTKSNDNVTSRSDTFVRGLAPVSDDYGTTNITNYKPSEVRFAPGAGECYKYSCFVTGSSSLRFARVFTARDIFSQDSYYFDPLTAGRIMDMAGSENYGSVYYGGEVTPYKLGGTVFFNSLKPDFDISTVSSLRKTVARYDDGMRNIYGYLGINATEGAGVFKFTPYTTVTITNCNVAYLYGYIQDINEDYRKIEKMMYTSTYYSEMRVVNQYMGSGITEDTRIFDLYPESGAKVIDVPKGFVYIMYTGTQMTDKGVVYDGSVAQEIKLYDNDGENVVGTVNAETAASKKAIITFNLPEQ